MFFIVKTVLNNTNMKPAKYLLLVLFFLLSIILFTRAPQVLAATSPSLTDSSGYSVLGGAAVTNTGTTTTNGAVGVSPGTSITGTATLTAGGGIQSNNASAIAAQADTVSVFGALDAGANADANCIGGIYPSGTDLTTISPLGPGVYCSAGSFLLTGNLTLSGTTGVWVFKTVSTLITSAGSSVTGGDPCNVWWRIGSAATLGTTTSFIGNIVTADVADTTALQTGATLNGRVLAQASATVTLDTNTITGPTCTASTTTTSTTSTALAPVDYTSAPNPPCPPIPVGIVAPNIIESRRVDTNSIFLSWGPYSGTDRFIVRYGPTNGNWLYNTDVTGFSTTLGNLPSDTPFWVQVAARNDCQIGEYGESRLVGGSSPMLPNTGNGSLVSNTPWYLYALVFSGVSVFLVLVQRRH